MRQQFHDQTARVGRVGFLFLLKIYLEGWGDGLVSKVLATKVWRPELDSPQSQN